MTAADQLTPIPDDARLTWPSAEILRSRSNELLTIWDEHICRETDLPWNLMFELDLIIFLKIARRSLTITAAELRTALFRRYSVNSFSDFVGLEDPELKFAAAWNQLQRLAPQPVV